MTFIRTYTAQYLHCCRAIISVVLRMFVIDDFYLFFCTISDCLQYIISILLICHFLNFFIYSIISTRKWYNSNTSHIVEHLHRRMTMTFIHHTISTYTPQPHTIQIISTTTVIMRMTFAVEFDWQLRLRFVYMNKRVDGAKIAFGGIGQMHNINYNRTIL